MRVLIERSVELSFWRVGKSANPQAMTGDAMWISAPIGRAIVCFSFFVFQFSCFSRSEIEAAPPAPPATSWPTFRNGLEQRGIAGIALPDQLKLKWKVSLQDGVVATSAVVGDHVFVPGLNGTLYCLKKESGEEVWAYRSIADVDPKSFAPGFKSAPTVTAEIVYCGDEDGVFHAVDRTTGKAKWTFKAGGEIAGSAAVIPGQIVFGSHDSNLYSLKPDGTLNWKFQTQDRINCSTAISGKHTFIAGCDHHLRVIDVETGKEKSDLDLQTYLIASPALFGNMLYVGTHDAEVLGINWEKEEVVWRYKDPQREFPYHSSAAVTEKHVFAGGQDKQLHCINRETGEGVWKFPTKGRIDSSPAVSGDRVYFGSADRNLYAVDLKTGKEVWKHNCGGDLKAGPAIGDGVLVIGAEGQNGAVFCFGK